MSLCIRTKGKRNVITVYRTQLFLISYHLYHESQIVSSSQFVTERILESSGLCLILPLPSTHHGGHVCGHFLQRHWSQDSIWVKGRLGRHKNRLDVAAWQSGSLVLLMGCSSTANCFKWGNLSPFWDGSRVHARMVRNPERESSVTWRLQPPTAYKIWRKQMLCKQG